MWGGWGGRGEGARQWPSSEVPGPTETLLAPPENCLPAPELKLNKFRRSGLLSEFRPQP